MLLPRPSDNLYSIDELNYGCAASFLRPLDQWMPPSPVISLDQHLGLYVVSIRLSHVCYTLLHCHCIVDGMLITKFANCYVTDVCVLTQTDPPQCHRWLLPCWLCDSFRHNVRVHNLLNVSFCAHLCVCVSQTTRLIMFSLIHQSIYPSVHVSIHCSSDNQPPTCFSLLCAHYNISHTYDTHSTQKALHFYMMSMHFYMYM